MSQAQCCGGDSPQGEEDRLLLLDFNEGGQEGRARVAMPRLWDQDEEHGGQTVAARAVPNPFTARTRIELELPRSANPPSAAVVAPSGRLVRMLASRGGMIEWDGRDAAGREVSAAGYLVRLDEAGGRTVRVIRIR